MASSNPPTSTPSLFFLDLPSKTFVGLDLLTFTSSPQFRGITHIPPGFHLLYIGTGASLSIRHGYWFHIAPLTADQSPQPLVWQWNGEEEALSLLPNEDAAVASPSIASRGLVDYVALASATADVKAKQSPADPDSDSPTEDDPPSWSSLTNRISNALLDRILPQATRPGATSTWPLSSVTSTAADLEATAKHIPGLSSSEALPVLFSANEVTLNLLPIDLARTFPADSTGRTRTAAARDRSWYLGHLIDSVSAPSDAATPSSREQGAGQLLGELQFAFLTVLTLSNYSALEGWKRLLDILLTCSTALAEIPGFFALAMRTLHAQVAMFDEVEGGLFELSDSAGGGMWLRKLLRRFRGALDDVKSTLATDDQGRRELEVELGKLEATMRDRYGWDDVGGSVLRRGRVQLEDGEEVEVQLDGVDEEEETGEWAPVVVDL